MDDSTNYNFFLLRLLLNVRTSPSFSLSPFTDEPTLPNGVGLLLQSDIHILSETGSGSGLCVQKTTVEGDTKDVSESGEVGPLHVSESHMKRILFVFSVLCTDLTGTVD